MSELIDFKPGTYISTVQVAELLDTQHDRWDARRARRWLQKAGAAIRRGSRWFTTPDLLREAYPEIYDELVKRAL